MIHRYFKFAGYLLPVFVVCTTMPLLGAKAKPSGTDLFVPTKKQWLCVEFNAQYAWKTTESGFHISAIDAAGGGKNEVMLYCRMRPETDRVVFNESIQTCRELLQSTAQKYGFDEWLTIKENVQLID